MLFLILLIMAIIGDAQSLSIPWYAYALLCVGVIFELGGAS